jgi:hypothetical protein
MGFEGYERMYAAESRIVCSDLFVEVEFRRGCSLFHYCHSSIIAGCLDGESKKTLRLKSS